MCKGHKQEVMVARSQGRQARGRLGVFAIPAPVPGRLLTGPPRLPPGMRDAPASGSPPKPAPWLLPERQERASCSHDQRVLAPVTWCTFHTISDRLGIF